MSLSRPPAEVEIDAGLVRRLLAAQYPAWAGLSLRTVLSAGWDNVIYRLGPDLAVRLPRRKIGAEQVAKQHRWLPVLARRGLPLAVPVIAGEGVPGAGYPWGWSVTSWLPGEIATSGDLDMAAAAVKLAGFIAGLREVDPEGGPASQFRRHLADCEGQVSAAVGALANVPYRQAAIGAWRRARAAPAWDGTGVWIHGDLHPANLLVTGGQLSGVIDFGLLAVGDPAVDLMVAWTLLSAPARTIFRTALPVDEATWERGRGWALVHGLRCAAYSADNPLLREIGNYTVSQVLSG